ncbi:MAG: YebC/PmpR family DNA-binding transcriptional regulator [Eubacteriales bacterium]|nr:YebC/PmpR family DNA-binding transcriptional regulator [Clostridiales bacterium]MDY5835879.1 YebC/PmpR family DNA-binding transcriptional regulator [Eubacteriales bacterium]
MSGHSKWNNIKRRKGAQDAAKGQIFTKLGKEIQMAVKHGGPDPNTNRALEDAIRKAKSNNMPNDSINRSISKASSSDSADFDEMIYEGYGPGGVAVILRSLTDNRNRTAGEVRHLFDKSGGNLGESGSVGFMFERKGSIILDKERYPDDETVMMEALDAGAEDITIQDTYYDVVTAPNEFHQVMNALQEAGYAIEDASVDYKPLTLTKLEDPDDQGRMEKLLENLEDFEDVNDIWHNWDMPEDADQD